MKLRIGIPAVILGLGLIFFGGGNALGLPSAGCLALGGNPASPAGECQINSLVTPGGVYLVPETLRICGSPSTCAFPGTGVLDLTSALTVTIGGDFVMDAGSEIDGDNKGSCPRTGFAITLNVTGDVTQVPDASIHSNSCSGGAIAITSKTGSIDIDGLVESVGTISGVGAHQPPGGGMITINAACNLTITPEGKVSSFGQDPGADLVHLQGGCKVVIDGLVQSTGVGHAVPNTPPNHCDATFRPGKPPNSTACVEVWAGDFLILDSTGINNGEINADRTKSASSGTSWIDLFARGNITLIGDTSGTLFDIHANGLAGTNDIGGTITVKSIEGTVTTSGTIIQANATNSGGKGGAVDVEAFGDVSFGTSQIQAKGATSGGGPQRGGTIFSRSWNGKVLGSAGGSLNAAGGPPAGSVKLQGCGTGPGIPGTDGVNYLGTTVPTPFTNLGNVCGGNPQLPTGYVVSLPVCACGGCFCLTSFFLNGTVLTINGSGLDTVKQVIFSDNCDPVGITVNKPFTSQSPGLITLNLPAGALGKHIVLFNAAAASSSCSTDTVH